MRTPKERPTRLVLISFLVLVCAPMGLRSQEALPGRTASFQFHLLGGFGISYAVPVLSQSAFRFTVDASWNSRDLGGTSKSTSSGNFSSSFDNSNTETDRSSYMLDAVFSYLSSTSIGSDANVFFGLGPVGRYGASSEISHYRITASSSSTFQRQDNEYTTTDRGIGVRGTFGFEMFVSSRLSFLAEYQVTALHIWTKYESKSRYDYGGSFNEYSYVSDQKGWQYDLHSVRLSVAVHL